MTTRPKSGDFARHLDNKAAVLAVEFQRFVMFARRVSTYTEALNWFKANCVFDRDGNCFYHGGRPEDTHTFIPIDLSLADKTAPYAELILHEQALHLQRLKKAH